MCFKLLMHFYLGDIDDGSMTFPILHLIGYATELSRVYKVKEKTIIFVVIIIREYQLLIYTSAMYIAAAVEWQMMR